MTDRRSVHCWIEEWEEYDSWRKRRGLTASAVHQALVNMLLAWDGISKQPDWIREIISDARAIQSDRLARPRTGVNDDAEVGS